ncbi:MAG: ATP-dependent protease subunit HslV [Candidatus Sumerlaeia bacterium]
MDPTTIRSTTILAVRKGGRTCIGGDGQVTLQNMIVKGGARKVRRLHDGKVLAGFAGASADALALFEKLEAKLQEHNGNLMRASVELAKDWRTDRYLRRLEAMLLAADQNTILLLSGTGDVIEPDGSILAIGSGGGYALAAAKALIDRDDMTAEQIVRRALEITSEICIYTNANIIVETI